MITRVKEVALLVLAMGMLGGWAQAVEPDAVVPLWPGDGLPPGVKVQDPQNQNPDAQGLIRHMDKPELRIFLPPADRATGTAVIICPGGGYGLLDYKAHVAEFVADYHQQGIAVIALLYKVPGVAAASAVTSAITVVLLLRYGDQARKGLIKGNLETKPDDLPPLSGDNDMPAAVEFR